MNKYFLIILTGWLGPLCASDKNIDNSWLEFEARNDDIPSTDESNPFGKFKHRIGDYEIVIPPISPELQQVKSREESRISNYNRSIKPGDKLPDVVYECTLKNIRGIGSDLAATMVWQSCLRLHLD